MDATGKVIWAKNNLVKIANVTTIAFESGRTEYFYLMFNRGTKAHFKWKRFWPV